MSRAGVWMAAAGLMISGLAVADPTPFQPDDLLGLALVHEVDVAKGATAVAASVRVPDATTDTFRSELQVISKEHDEVRTHALGSASFASWSRDGTTLYFVVSEAGITTLRAYDRQRHSTATLISLPHWPRYLSWSPDESHIAVVTDVPDPSQRGLDAPAVPAAASLPVIIDHPVYRTNEGSWLPSMQPRLEVFEVRSGIRREIPLPTEVSLTETETGDGGAPTWTRDAGALVISVARGRDPSAPLWSVNRDLLRIEVHSGATTWLAQQPGVERDPSIAPDGRRLAYLRQRGDARQGVFYSELVVRDLASGQETAPLAARDIDVDSFAWRPDSRGWIVRYLERGRVRLASVTMDGVARVISDEVAFGSSPARIASDGTIAFVRSSPSLPSEAFSIDASGVLTPWTDLNQALRLRTLSKVRDLEYRSAHVDRRLIHAILAAPPPSGKESLLPVIVDLHGGPYSARTFNFDPDREFFVSQGYVVIQPHFRGSWGYGEAFAQLSDRKHYPGRYDAPEAPEEMGLDVVGVLRAIREQRIGDPQRVFLRGISAGALVASWTLGRTSEFRAAVAQSWYPGEWSAPAYGAYQIRRYFTGPPWDPEHQPEYWRRQPLMLIPRIVTPLLLLHGEDDWITPLMEAEKFYYALRSAGREVVLAVYPGEIHGLRRHPASRLNSLSMEASWFRAHDPARPAGG